LSSAASAKKKDYEDNKCNSSHCDQNDGPKRETHTLRNGTLRELMRHEASTIVVHIVNGKETSQERISKKEHVFTGCANNAENAKSLALPRKLYHIILRRDGVSEVTKADF